MTRDHLAALMATVAARARLAECEIRATRSIKDIPAIIDAASSDIVLRFVTMINERNNTLKADLLAGKHK